MSDLAKGTSLIYIRVATRVRLRALAHLDGRTLIEYLDRLARREVNKIDTTRYNRAVERVEASPAGPTGVG